MQEDHSPYDEGRQAVGALPSATNMGTSPGVLDVYDFPVYPFFGGMVLGLGCPMLG